jgi:allantoate deiminase
MDRYLTAAHEAIHRCRHIATYSEETGRTTRTFLSPPMRDVHADFGEWMAACGLAVSVDSAGNLRGTRGDPPKLVIASHLDTVPDAGAYDGVLGVVLGVSLASLTATPVEVIGFSEEEGVRFGVPFIGSRALIGDLPTHPEILKAIRQYGLDPGQTCEPTRAKACLEFHIEQGPILESLNLPLGMVEAIVGQSRLDVTFTGQTNHAGTTPMALRSDALAAVAEWIQSVEHEGLATEGLVATVGRVVPQPNVRNAINGSVLASLDVRHADDGTRLASVTRLMERAGRIAQRRGLRVTHQTNLDQAAVPLDAGLTEALAGAAAATGHPVHRMTSGAGHDAMILAKHLPTAMLFLRSPGGISHHPAERVLVEDVAAALETGVRFLQTFEAHLV